MSSTKNAAMGAGQSYEVNRLFLMKTALTGAGGD